MTEQKQPESGVPGAKYLGVGIMLVGSTGLFLWLGSLLDARWGSEPALTVAGAFVGAAAGFYNLYRQLVSDTRRAANEKETGRKQ
ncbi:MAG: AtpZ/AtpI family protein [Gemmatimonadota bacterium]